LSATLKHAELKAKISLSPLFFLTAYLYTFQGVEPRHRQENLQANPFDESLKQQGENNTHSLNEQIFNQPRQFANGKKELTKEELEYFVDAWREETCACEA
jgi:hypothetical protein